MKTQGFSLKPLARSVAPEVEITGEVGRRSNRLVIRFELTGPLSDLAVPAPVETPVRKNALWEETCFEFFVGLKHADNYWEFNLSPAGHWNAYRLASYRQGMQEERAFATLPFELELKPGALLLSLELDLKKIVPPEQPLQMGVSAVLKRVDGATTYWALIHPGAKADFHCRESFLLELGTTTP